MPWGAEQSPSKQNQLEKIATAVVWEKRNEDAAEMVQRAKEETATYIQRAG